jgi:CRP-like cAMP-binding protein
MNSPFNGISAKEKKKLLTLLTVHIYDFNPGDDILEAVKTDDIIGIIAEGFAEIKRINYNGDENIIDELDKDSIFGTNISSINHSEFEIIAKEKTTVIIIDTDKLIDQNLINLRFYNIFILNMLSIINEKVQQKNERIRILTRRTIRNKLLEYFAIEQSKHHSRYIYLPFNFTNLADYLAIDRSAMTRELKYLKDEGFIEIKGKRITLIN